MYIKDIFDDFYFTYLLPKFNDYFVFDSQFDDKFFINSKLVHVKYKLSDAFSYKLYYICG